MSISAKQLESFNLTRMAAHIGEEVSYSDLLFMLVSIGAM